MSNYDWGSGGYPIPPPTSPPPVPPSGPGAPGGRPPHMGGGPPVMMGPLNGQIPDWINQRRAALGLPPMTWPTNLPTGAGLDAFNNAGASKAFRAPDSWYAAYQQHSPLEQAPPPAGGGGDGRNAGNIPVDQPVGGTPLPAPPPGSPPWYSYWQNWMRRRMGGGGGRGIY